MNRRAFLSAVPAVALVATPVAAMQLRPTSKERLQSAIIEVEAAFREMYPSHKVVKRLNEIREIDDYEPNSIMLFMLAQQ